jgi:hypothetical protein
MISQHELKQAVIDILCCVDCIDCYIINEITIPDTGPAVVDVTLDVKHTVQAVVLNKTLDELVYSSLQNKGIHQVVFNKHFRVFWE